METTDRATTVKILEEIRKRNGGILKAEAVVEAAEDPGHPLHDRFTWDDTEAARQYRLWQARQIIRVTVSVLHDDVPEQRVYVSLHDDRGEEGGGYRAVVDVLRDKDLRAKMVQEALDDLREWEAKYHQLKELADIFAAAKRVRSARK